MCITLDTTFWNLKYFQIINSHNMSVGDKSDSTKSCRDYLKCSIWETDRQFSELQLSNPGKKLKNACLKSVYAEKEK